MGRLARMDRHLIDAADAMVARLQEGGRTVPALLRDVSQAIVALLLLIPLADLMQGDYVMSALAAMVFLPEAIVRVGRWRTYAKDAEREWSAELAARYLARALWWRSARRRERATYWALLCAIAPATLVTGPEPAVLVLSAAAAAFVAEGYFCCALPRMPSRRRAELTPSHAMALAA